MGQRCGYNIWYHRAKYIEAERHAIWEKDGEYTDLTFNADGEDRILFSLIQLKSRAE